MGVIGSIQIYLFLGLALVAFALEVWALVHSLRMPAPSFEAADKRTKRFWSLILVGAVLIGFLGIPRPLGIGILPVLFVLLAVAPAAIYLTDVRPAVTRYRGYGQRDQGRW